MLPPGAPVWIDAEALYYLPETGPEFEVPAVGTVRLDDVVLDFGGSVSGTVFTVDSQPLPGVELCFTRLDIDGTLDIRRFTTDSHGGFLASALEDGHYTLAPAGWGFHERDSLDLEIERNAPTLSMDLRLGDGIAPLPARADPQQFRLYRAERLVSSSRHTFSSLFEVQVFVNTVVFSPWWLEHFPDLAAIDVWAGLHREPARGWRDFELRENGLVWQAAPRGGVELPSWSWDTLVVLHEVAHTVSPGRHGPEFAGAFLALTRQFIGTEAAANLNQAFDSEGVSCSPLERMGQHAWSPR